MEIGERQAKGNERNLCLKGWETLVILTTVFDLNSNTVIEVILLPSFSKYCHVVPTRLLDVSSSLSEEQAVNNIIGKSANKINKYFFIIFS